jgi:hypothetical protein
MHYPAQVQAQESDCLARLSFKMRNQQSFCGRLQQRLTHHFAAVGSCTS